VDVEERIFHVWTETLRIFLAKGRTTWDTSETSIEITPMQSQGVIHNAVEGRGTVSHLVPDDLGLSIVFEMAISFESPFHDLPKFGRERVLIEEMMYAKARTRRFG
jgi:hypothetical protein